MKIDIRYPGKRAKHIRYPNWLMLNALTAHFIARRMKKHTEEKTLTAKQLRLLFRMIRREAKRLKGSWVFADIRTRTGTHITFLP